MNESDALQPASSDALLNRMIVVGRLAEHLERREPKRALLDAILQRMLLFSRMSDRIGIAAPESPLMRAILREIELGCFQCDAWRRCQAWLDGRSPEDDHRDFCPNEGLFAVLPKQNSINRPYAAE